MLQQALIWRESEVRMMVVFLMLFFLQTLTQAQTFSDNLTCKFNPQRDEQETRSEFFFLLQKSCEAFIDYCQNFSEKNCLERINSLEATRNHRERSTLIYLSNQKLALANNIFSTVSLDNTQIEETNIHEYESKLNILDGLSRDNSPLIREFILDLKNNLQAHWMAEYFHSWMTWQNLNSDLFSKAGLPLSLITGQMALYNIKDSGVFTKFLNQTLPGKLFSLSSFGFRVSVPYITIESIKSTNPPPAVMPMSPAHLIRFDFQNYEDEEIEAFITSIEKSQSHDQIRAGIVISSLFLLGDLHLAAPQVYPKWIPNWVQNLMRSGATSPSPASAKKWSFNPKNLIRLTPQSLVATVAIDQGVSQGIKSYTERQVHNQIVGLLHSTSTEDETIKNARDLMKTLAELDIFYTKNSRESYFLNRDFILAVQYAIDNQLSLTSFMDEYFYDHVQHLKASGIEMVRHLNCASQRDINYLLVGRREVYQLENQFKGKKEAYLSGLWTYSHLLSTLLNSHKTTAHLFMKDIIEGKIKQLQMEHAQIANESLAVNFQIWTPILYNRWFKPVAEYFNEKKRRESYMNPNSMRTSQNKSEPSPQSNLMSQSLADENQIYENLNYCRFVEQ